MLYRVIPSGPQPATMLWAARIHLTYEKIQEDN